MRLKDIINLTAHPITLMYGRDGRSDAYTIAPSGNVARVSSEESIVRKSSEGVPIITRKFNQVTGLPTDITTPCIVSSIVLAATDRPNTYAPDTGRTAIRDNNGKIIAVRRLVTL